MALRLEREKFINDAKLILNTNINKILYDKYDKLSEEDKNTISKSYIHVRDKLINCSKKLNCSHNIKEELFIIIS